MEEASTRILIVDDDESLCAILSQCLSVLCECDTAVSAAAAIEALKIEEFRLMLTDISMPGMSGLELCEFVRRHYPKTVVIVMSMHTSKPYEVESLRRGAFGFLAKPFDRTLLLEMARSALRWRGKSTVLR